MNQWSMIKSKLALHFWPYIWIFGTLEWAFMYYLTLWLGNFKAWAYLVIFSCTGHAMPACISCPLSNTALIIILDLNNCGKLYCILTSIWHVSKTKICISRKSSPQYRGEEGVQSQMGLHSKVWGWIIQMTSNYLNKFCSNLNKEISLLRFETLAMLYIWS